MFKKKYCEVISKRSFLHHLAEIFKDYWFILAWFSVRLPLFSYDLKNIFVFWRQICYIWCTSCTERPLPRPSGYEPVLSRRRFARSTCTWTVSNIPRLTKTLHQSYNDGMVNPEVVCHPSMAKTTVMDANRLPPSWYG